MDKEVIAWAVRVPGSCFVWEFRGAGRATRDAERRPFPWGRLPSAPPAEEKYWSPTPPPIALLYLPTLPGAVRSLLAAYRKFRREWFRIAPLLAGADHIWRLRARIRGKVRMHLRRPLACSCYVPG